MGCMTIILPENVFEEKIVINLKNKSEQSEYETKHINSNIEAISFMVVLITMSFILFYISSMRWNMKMILMLTSLCIVLFSCLYLRKKKKCMTGDKVFKDISSVLCFLAQLLLLLCFIYPFLVILVS